MRYSILSVLLAISLVVTQVYGACKQQTSSWKPKSVGCPPQTNAIILPSDQTFHCGSNPEPGDVCCGYFNCDQYSRDDRVLSKNGQSVEWDIHCETAAGCGGKWTLAFDQTDCGNINGCYQGGQCCSLQSIPDPKPHSH